MIRNEPPERTHPKNAFKGVIASDGTDADESGESFCTSTDCLLAGIFQQKNTTCANFRFAESGKSQAAQKWARAVFIGVKCPTFFLRLRSPAETAPPRPGGHRLWSR
jgi:hypothetical protein